MAKTKSLRPGQPVKISGQYELKGPRGGRQHREATLVTREPAPPAPKPGMKWALVDATRHRRR